MKCLQLLQGFFPARSGFHIIPLFFHKNVHYGTNIRVIIYYQNPGHLVWCCQALPAKTPPKIMNLNHKSTNDTKAFTKNTLFLFVKAFVSLVPSWFKKS